MVHYHTELTIDFGEVGYWNSKQPFRVRLHGNELTELIKDAENAHRVYELMLIDRPGDIWAYIWVVIEDVSSGIKDQYLRAWQDAQPQYSDNHPWPLNQIPFSRFDEFFYWCGDDTHPEDEAWLNHRNSKNMKAFADQMLVMVRAAQANLGWNDDLLRHMIQTIRAGKHPYAYLDRRIANKQCEGRVNQPLHTQAFYQKLDNLLGDPELVSVAYRDGRDYQVLKQMATEQRQRANLTGHRPENALHLSAVANNKISNDAWGSEICLFDEGLAHGDLHIEGISGGRYELLALVNEGWRRPGRYILSAEDEGDFPGYVKESGDGWVLYRQSQSDSRRRCLERIAGRRHHSRPILQFWNAGQTLYEFERTLVIVGVSIDTPTRTALAGIIAAWQQTGGEPVLIILGDPAPFESAGCSDILQPTAYLSEKPTHIATDWLKIVLREKCRWLDVIIALDAPDWAAEILNQAIQSADRPWPIWIVSNSNQGPLKPDVILEDGLAENLTLCQQNALTMPYES